MVIVEGSEMVMVMVGGAEEGGRVCSGEGKAAGCHYHVFSPSLTASTSGFLITGMN